MFNLAAVLVDFATDVQILDRHAVTLPTPVNHVTIFRHFGLLHYCASDASCLIYFGYQLWPNLQPPVRPLPPGQYLRIQIAHQFEDADAFWREVRRRPRPPSRSRTPPLRPHAGERIGEASNPGPSYWLGTVNPTGLRNKEMHLATLPQGVWGIQESHLSGVTQRPCTLALQRAFRDTGRSIFCVPGAPVALRARSSETGIWAGVLFASSLIAKPLTWHWPNDEFALGRVQAAQFWVGPFTMTGVNLYGWARSPTWPQAIQATNDLLETITKELIMSRTGPRFVVGDFNLREEHAPLLAMWRDLGWTEVQDWAYIQHSRAYTPTCKKSTYPDKIFISPELLPFIRSVRTWELFPDHDVLGARLELPALAVPHTIWPLPSEVPWSHVDREQWQQSTPKVAASLSITDHFLHFCDSYEHSFDGCISTPERKLPSNCRGRGTVTAPKLRRAQCPSLKASRPGELQPGAFQLGRAVMAWFKQLRRFQSMVHSLRSSNTSANAQLYRAQLWHAIKDGRGFQQGFVKWWPTRNIRLQGLPSVLPHGVPHRGQAELLFLDFQHNYRQFESWHARRRRELLNTSFQTSRAKIFKVIQPGPPAPLSFLEKTDMCAILSVDSTGTLVTVDNPLPQGEDVSYDIDGVAVDVTSVSPASFHLEGDCLFWPGQKIRATTSLTTQAGIQAELQRFWEPRWCRSPPSSTDWTRIMNFARAHLPPGSMVYTEITSDHWRASLKRYAPHAARGPDGFTRLDLVQMPPAFVDNLMQQIIRWESQRAWPTPLLAGFVHPLAKRETSIGAGDYRPIVIYPLIYRTWGSIRAKQLLRHLRGWTTQHQFGFMPGVEAAELFYVTQALIEVSVLEDAGHCGLITDLQKAFECLPREPVWQVAEWLGIPLEILHLWAAYLETMKRHFRVDGQFGPGLPSTSGYPEGCALSCAAMGLVNVCFHAYMLAFAPTVTALSYVDNLELVARDGFSLLQAQIALLSWTELWTLQLDDEKTFVWGTTPELRRECEGLRRPVLRTAKDLGAQITYGKGHFVAEQVKRLESLKPLWSMLHRSGAALHHKQTLLQQALWPRAFFGIAVCRLGFAHIRSLRTAAVRALHFGKAGAHPGLRLFLLSPVLCDPGFYQVWQVLATFRRLWYKQRSLHDLWDAYLASFAGCLTDGPFGKMLEIFDQLGWTMMQAPCVLTTDGVLLDLATTALPALRRLTEDAWAQCLAREVSHRQDFAGLAGIDVWALKHLRRRLTPHQQACTASLQEGAFVDRAQFHKFDLAVDALCAHCGQPDTLLHRATTCLGFLELHAEHQDAVALILHRPISFGLRLLPPRHPQWGAYFRSLQAEPEPVPWLKTFRHPCAMVHLFTDGSCKSPEVPVLALGAGAVVSATHDELIGSGALPGLEQTSDRAEVYAIVAAVEWAAHFLQPVTIWSDSSYAATGLARLLHDRADLPGPKDYDLWLRLQAALGEVTGLVRVQHTSAHRTWQGIQDWSDWTAYWNDRADRAAGAAHALRQQTTRTLWQTLCCDFEQNEKDLFKLVDYHVALSTAAQMTTSSADADDEGPDSEILVRSQVQTDWAIDLPLNWRLLPACQDLGARFGVSATFRVLAALVDVSDSATSVVLPVSWLEVTFWLHNVLSKNWPVSHSVLPGHWIDRNMAPAAWVTPTSLAAAMRWVRAFFAAAESAFSLGLTRQSGIDLKHLGVFVPQHGMLLRINFCLLEEAQRLLKQFTAGRLIRVANDLSRAF